MYEEESISDGRTFYVNANGLQIVRLNQHNRTTLNGTFLSMQMEKRKERDLIKKHKWN